MNEEKHVSQLLESEQILHSDHGLYEKSKVQRSETLYARHVEKVILITLIHHTQRVDHTHIIIPSNACVYDF